MHKSLETTCLIPYLWGGGWVRNKHSRSLIYMLIVWTIIIALILIGIIYGSIGSSNIDLTIELKLFSNPYYVLGVSFEGVEIQENYLIEEFILGLFFINIVLTFHKINA